MSWNLKKRAENLEVLSFFSKTNIILVYSCCHHVVRSTVRGLILMEIYFALKENNYNSMKSSDAKTRDESFEQLVNDIVKYNVPGDVLLSGDFNARTGTNPDFIWNDDNVSDFVSLPLSYIYDLPPHSVHVCIAMMLSLIFLTGTPSNRTSRVRADRVAGWRVTVSYNELLICNPGCNPVCNTGGPGRCRQRSAGSSW